MSLNFKKCSNIFFLVNYILKNNYHVCVTFFKIIPFFIECNIFFCHNFKRDESFCANKLSPCRLAIVVYIQLHSGVSITSSKREHSIFT